MAISLRTSKPIGWSLLPCFQLILSWPWCFTSFHFGSLAGSNCPLRAILLLLQLVLTRPWSIFLSLSCSFTRHRILRSLWPEFRIVASGTRRLTSFHLAAFTGPHDPLRSILRLPKLVRPRSWRRRSHIFSSGLRPHSPLWSFSDCLPHLVLSWPWH